MLPEITAEELSAALDHVVTGILGEADVDAPPVDAFAIAQSLGFDVAWDNRQSGRARLVRLEAVRQPSILLRAEPRQERRQFAVAHEIGEAFSHRVFEQLGIAAVETVAVAREKTANHLAGRLLLPTRWFYAAGIKRSWDLAALKRQFHTASHELIARRMLDFPPPVILTVVDDGRVTFRRTNTGGHAPPLFDVERQCQRWASEWGEPASDGAASMSVRAWPIHEPEWRREIIRTEFLLAGDTA
jgi:hypothetical protein